VQASREEFWGRGREIRVGLMQVRGLAHESIESILTARRADGPFRDLADFLARVAIPPAEVASLVRCGAMDAFGSTRPRLLWELELRVAAARAGPGAMADGAVRAGALAMTRARVDTLVDKIPALPAYDARQRMRAELEVLEMTLESHPFALFVDTLDRVRRLRPVVTSETLRRHEGDEIYLLGWKVTSKRTSTVDDEPMCFVTFSDEHGRFEASFFPEVYARYALELVRGMGPFLLKGRVEVAFGVAEVVASHVKLLPARVQDGSSGS